MSAATDIAYVSPVEQSALPPPRRERGVVHWLRANLFSSWLNSILTLISIAFLAWTIPPIVRWTFIDAVWTGDSREACVGPDVGACWAFVKAKFAQFMYGRYPFSERWRVDLLAVLLGAGLIPMAIPRVPYKRENAIYLLVVLPVVAFVLLTGGVLGLAPVPTSLWGGLLVTLVVALVAIVVSVPLGILLALARRSNMAVIRIAAVTFIEFVRGVPLITVLFMSSVMLPIFLPPGTDFDKLLRALVGVSLFASAYMAEVVRGGLQGVAKGQHEAAAALGLNYRRTMGLIVLPQALKIVIPGIVNSFISLFKDTSLVLIIGIYDLLGIVQLGFADPNWVTPTTPTTGYVFAAIVFWIFCFSMSRYSIYTERRLDTGHRR